MKITPKGEITTEYIGFSISSMQLSLPTAMTFGPDGNLYVSNWGFGPPPIGAGQILKITVP
jgi:hypothetical protein